MDYTNKLLAKIKCQRPTVKLDGVDISHAISLQVDLDKVMNELDLAKFNLYAVFEILLKGSGVVSTHVHINKSYYLPMSKLDIRIKKTFNMILDIYAELKESDPEPFVQLRTNRNFRTLAKYVCHVRGIDKVPRRYEECYDVISSAFTEVPEIFRTEEALYLFDFDGEIECEYANTQKHIYRTTVSLEIDRPSKYSISYESDGTGFGNSSDISFLNPLFVILSELD